MQTGRGNCRQGFPAALNLNVERNRRSALEASALGEASGERCAWRNAILGAVMRDQLPIAVIGCGFWGSKHVRVVHQDPTLRVAVAIDSREDRRNYIESQYPGVPTGATITDAIKSDAAGVIIASPISSHYALAKEALLAGKHVLVEKPLTMSSAECRELISLADSKSLALMVGHTFEYHPAVRKVREIVQSGAVGEPYYATSRRLNLGLYQRDSNVLWDLAPHDLSIIFHVLDAEVDTVEAWGCAHVIKNVEDVVYAKLGLNTGAMAHIHVSWLDPVKVRQFNLVGSEGMLVFDDSHPTEKVRVFDKRFKPTVVGDAFADFQSAYHNGNTAVPDLPSGEPLHLEVLDFAEAIRTGKRPVADGYSGLRVVEALERISERLAPDAENGRPFDAFARPELTSAAMNQPLSGVERLSRN